MRLLKYIGNALPAIAVATIIAGAAATDISAQTYTQLQVLLPGETAAPGLGTGKLGTPVQQTVGVPFTITVRACDSQWNTVTSITNLMSITSSDASATLPSNTALVNGTIDLGVTLNAAGSFTFSAEDQSDITIPLATSANVTSLLLQGFEFETISQKHKTAGVPSTTTIWAVDPNGDVVTGFSGAVRLQEITSFGVGRISPEIVTLTGGQWSGEVTMYRADETSINRGNVNMLAELISNPSKNGTSNPFVVHPGPFSHVQIVVPGENPAPGSVSGVTGSPATQSVGQSFVVNIYATDDYWNPVPSSDQVRVTSSDGSPAVNGTLTNGWTQLTFVLNTTGNQTVTVTDQTNGSIQGTTSAPILVINSTADHFEFDPIPSPVNAGQPVSVTIRATDVGGNTITDYNGNAILSANTGPGSITPEAILFVNGVWTGNMEFRGAGGAVSFTCSDFSSPPHFGTTPNFVVLPGPFSGLQVLLPGQAPAGGTSAGFTGTPTDQNAGSSFNLTIRAVDAFWNRVSGINDLIQLTSSDSFAVMPVDTSLANGELVFPITLFKGGLQTITATDLDSGGINPHTSSQVNILGGPYSRIVIVAPGQYVAAGAPNGQAGTALDQSINFAFTVSVVATDAWWNPVSGVTDMVRITSGDPLAQLPPDAPLVDGRADFNMRLSTGGFQLITAANVTQPAMPTSTTQVRAISSGLHLEAEVTPTNVQAGEPFNLTVKVTNDAGAVIQEINSFVTVSVQNASTQAPGRGTLLNTQFQLLQGQRTIAETYTYAEDIVLVITDDAGNDPAATEVISVSPGTPAELVLTSDPVWVGGNKHATITAECRDAYNNGVPGEPVVFQLLNSNGTLTPLDSATTSNGTAQADFLSPKIPEIGRIRVTSNALLAEIDIETALVDPTRPGGHITNFPNPFHPNEAPTTIAYKLNDNAQVTLRIYTLSGALVLEQQFQSGVTGGIVGLNQFQWDGRNGEGDFVASGGYVAVVEALANGQTIHVMRRKIAVVR